MITIYGLKSCSSCRKALAWFRAHGVEHEFSDLRADGISVQTIERWADRVEWQALLNTRSLTWRRIPELDRQHLTRGAAIALMLEHPTVIKRPVLESKERMVIGFDADTYARLYGG